MLLTLTATRDPATGGPATDLGFLLHKHPQKLQTFEVAVGAAHVFYPEATEDRCTAALLLEVDPIALVRGRKGSAPEGFALGQYVNDRPYAASSMLAVAMSRVFKTAMAGRCDARPELAATSLQLEIHVPALPCRGGPELAARLFQPLGWQVMATAVPLDERFPEWGESRYVDLRLAGTVRVADALQQLYVLLPVLDDAKHYWVSIDEVDKLIRAGAGWLAGHPERELITRRYLHHLGSLAAGALARLAELADTADLGEPAELAAAAEIAEASEIAVAADVPDTSPVVPLVRLRHEAVLAALRTAGAMRIADLGCGDGALIAPLLADPRVTHVLGADVSARALERASRRLRLDELSERARERVTLVQSSLTYRDARLAGFDAAVLMEVVEHLDPPRLPALERTVFGDARPRTVIVTTPNAEHNARFESLVAGTFRHRDHRFEWTRAEFRDWAARVSTSYGYDARFVGVGSDDPLVGPPTQLAVFTTQDNAGQDRAAEAGGRPTMSASTMNSDGDPLTPAPIRELAVPAFSLVVLVGVSGSGKSTFASRVFAPTETLSSDFFRGLVADDQNDQAATPDAFEALYFVAGKRLAAGRLTVVDATNVQPDARRRLVALAKEYDVLPVAIVLDLPERLCADRNAARPDRTFGPQVLRRQSDMLRRSLRGLQREGFRTVHVLKTPAQVDAVRIVRTRLYNDLRHETGPFDVVGDVHGCAAELETLLGKLGYEIALDEAGRPIGAHHPAGRRVIFLGDLVDRGPDTPRVLRLAMGMVADGDALAVPGNHESKLLRALQGRQVQASHGLAESLAQLEAEPAEFQAQVTLFLDGLVSHYVLDAGRLAVAHAGITERFQGRASARVRAFCLYGDTTGETDEFGLPVRYPWATDYRGSAMVLYGHTPIPDPEWVNNTLCLDTGCVFGGRLTALRYPERELVSVPAERVYHPSAKPFSRGVDADGPAAEPDATGAPEGATRRDPDVLDIQDVIGTRAVETRHHGRIRVRAENAAAALEVMSRFALDPRWLLYLPPTMSPVATSTLDGLLEHPAQAFEAYRSVGVGPVICEEKHMGSRAVVVLPRDEAAARQYFGGPAGTTGAVYTRTGRAFFEPELTEQLLSRLRAAAGAAGLFGELDTDWLVLDTELLPWSAKALELLKNQYAAVGAAARAALPAAVAALEQASAAGVDTGDLLARTESRLANAAAFTDAYRRYCWPTDGLAGVQIAPFQVLAGQHVTYHDRPHSWHLDIADRLVAADPELVRSTRRIVADTSAPESETAVIRWWEDLTGAGGEGMVVKPMANLTRGRRGIVQPGLKVRGREYLRIIYGPDYTESANLSRLLGRGLGHKRSLATREYALGLEGLDRAAAGDPLWRIHECVFAVLALESEPVDPRL